jgi:hypothetical protein
MADAAVAAPAAAPAATTTNATASTTAGGATHGKVIKSMVERFRYGSPLSRAERAKMRESGEGSADFWWKREGVAGAGSVDSSFVAGAAPTDTNNGAQQQPSSGSVAGGAPADPNASFASFLPDTQPAPSYRYGGAAGSAPQTPGQSGKPVVLDP